MSLLRQLQQTPESFSFLQILRLLELHQQSRKPKQASSNQKTRVMPGVDFRPPSQEPVRLRGQHSLEFPASEVEQLTQEGERWNLQANFIGLDGALGPLPYHYTELLLERQKAKDPALLQFLDLFNHRTASLFWRAASKYKLPLEFERARGHRADGKTVDRHTEILLSLIGLSPRLLQDDSALPSEALIYYGGLLSQKVKTASNLRQIIGGNFDVPVSIEEFAGTWCEVLPSMRCRLPTLEQPSGQNNCLGRTTLVGQKSWLAQNKVNIKLGPLSREQYQRFTPGSQTLQSLIELSSLYLGAENQFDLKLKVKAEAMPRTLRLGTGQPYRLGWDSRLPESIYRAPDPEATVDIPVSSNRVAEDSSNSSTYNTTPAEGRNAA